MFYQVRAAPSRYAKFSKSSGSAELWGFSAAGSSGTKRAKGQSGHRIAKEITYQHSHSTSIRHPRRKRRPRLHSGVIANKGRKGRGKKSTNQSKTTDPAAANLGETPSPPQNERAARSRRIRPCRRHPGARCQAGAAGGHPLRSCLPAGLPAYHTPTPPGKA